MIYLFDFKFLVFKDEFETRNNKIQIEYNEIQCRNEI